jgi:hypothetical protein
MRCWAVLISADRWQSERAHRHERLELAGLDDESGALRADLRLGDRVAVVADVQPPALVALGRVAGVDYDEHNADDAEAPPASIGLAIGYTWRAAETGHAVARPGAPIVPLDGADFLALASAVESPDSAADLAGERPATPSPTGARRSWLVSLDLPIEAETAAEASRLFWGYVRDLGPDELPTFVSPSGDELAMQAMVAGEPVNLDPEEDD